MNKAQNRNLAHCYDDALYAELLKRQAELESGQAGTYTWEEVQERAEKNLQDVRKNRLNL